MTSPGRYKPNSERAERPAGTTYESDVFPRPAALVREFHEAFGYPISDTPRVPTDGLRDLRKLLTEQETAELIEAIEADDLLGVAQELADVVYVAYGTAVTYGIDLDAVVAEVHRANMTKDVGTTGKAVKGERFKPARVAAVVLGGPPVSSDERGCYGWPRTCDHLDDLGCMDAEQTPDNSDNAGGSDAA